MKIGVCIIDEIDPASDRLNQTMTHQRTEQERQRAEQAEQKADKLAQRLRAMGINPEVI